MKLPQPLTFRTSGGQTIIEKSPPLIIYDDSEVTRDHITPGSHVRDESTNTRYRVGRMRLVSDRMYEIILTEDPEPQPPTEEELDKLNPSRTFSRNIGNNGQPFKNQSNGSTSKGVLKDGVYLFDLAVDISPGQILINELSGHSFICAEVRRNQLECVYIRLHEYSTVVDVKRYSDNSQDTFGRTTSDQLTVEPALPVIFNHAQNVAVVQMGAAVVPGDTLFIQATNESYVVLTIRGNGYPGLKNLVVQKLDQNVSMAE